ncbi:MAG: serine/threonine-protein kinase [Acidobacteria bacterium]|nr:serine/threonine-protein kinase [Acidobacteriota bacterium]
MIGQSVGHFRITALLGEGGMGAVYRASDTRLNRDVAIKVLPDAFASDPDRLARFQREAQVLASVSHPNIATIFGIEERAIVMELIEGPTLADRMAQGAMAVDEALAIARQIAEALEAAHEKGIIHRDLKPANVKVSAEGKVKVLDFGLAKLADPTDTTEDPASAPTVVRGNSPTMAGVIMGTAGYMSPEQARGLRVDKRADIWAYGVVLFEMLSGKMLFAGGETVTDMIAAVVLRDPDWTMLPVDTPAPVKRLLRRCLERDRKKRLPDIAVARMEIEEALGGAPEAPVVAATAAVPAPKGVERWWMAVAAVMTVAAAGLAIVHFRETLPSPQPVRFHVPPPENSTFSRYGMVLSPDGRNLAFIAAGGGGLSMLWLRPLDSLTARALPGTEGANFSPFWSPDSRSIGFLVQGKLKRIEAAGGPPQTLCEVPGTLIGGSWSRDGVIVFGTITGGLLRVSQAGGTPTQLTKSDQFPGELGHMRPWFLPDGQHFLYVSRTGQQDGSAIYLASLDGKPRRLLVRSQQAGVYAPPAPGSEHGHLLFLRDGILMAQPLHPTRYEPAGDAFPVAEQVGSTLALGYFAVSTNGVLAYRTGSARGTGISRLYWFDRQGKQLESVAPLGSYAAVELSPDGKRVASARLDANNRDVWLSDIVRGVSTRFTFHSGLDQKPVWSADGERVIFASDRESAGIPALYSKDSSGSGNEELLLPANGAPLWPNSWSPDGRHLLYSRMDLKTQSDLWVLPVGSGSAGAKPTPYLQTPANEDHGKFSPDGRWIAYVSNESGENHVYVQSFPAGRGKFQVSTGSAAVFPRWRRDGKEIYYVSRNDQLMAVEVKTSPTFAAGTPQALFKLPFATAGRTYTYDVDASGKRFLVSSTYDPAGETAAPITVVLNWQAAVKR